MILGVAPPGPNAYLVISMAMFMIGALGFLVRKNALVMFMCIELMLNAVNLALISFGRALDDVGGQVLVLFVLVVATAEVMVGLGIMVAIFRRRVRANIDDLNSMRG